MSNIAKAHIASNASSYDKHMRRKRIRKLKKLLLNATLFSFVILLSVVIAIKVAGS